jgi:hypothetical protein
MGYEFFSFDGDPIYDIEGCFQTKNIELFPLEQPYVIANDPYVWQHEDDMITDLFQPPRDGSLQHSHDGFQSYPGSCDIYPFEHLDLSYEEGFNHFCAQTLMKMKL